MSPIIGQQKRPDLKIVQLEAGDPSLVPYLAGLAWKECEELQVRPQSAWTEHITSLAESAPRYELGYVVDGQAVAGMVLVPDNDVHVGPCLTVLTQYVRKEYRSTRMCLGMMRQAVRIAREAGFTCLAWSHRVGPWRYEIIYRRT